MAAAPSIAPPATVLVTGAAGKLGTATVNHLVEAGYTVRATDISAAPHLPVHCAVADLMQPQSPYALCEGADALVHLGNIPNGHRTDPQTTYATNTRINMNVVQAALELGVPRLLFSSSIQVISSEVPVDLAGPPPFPRFPLDGSTPRQPGNAYALSKAAGEATLRYACTMHGLTGVSLRLPWVRRFHRRRYPLRQGKTIFADFCAYLYVEEAVRLIEACLRAPLEGYRHYLPSMREPMDGSSVADFYTTHYANVPLDQPLETLDSFVDNRAITAETGWSPGSADDYPDDPWP